MAVRDRNSYNHAGRSSLEVADMPSRPKWHSKNRHKHHHRWFKKHGEKRGKYCSGSSQSHHDACKEKEVEGRRNMSDVRRHGHRCQSSTESVLDRSLSRKLKKQQKQSSHTSRHSNHNAKLCTDDLSHDRWQMVSGSDEDDGEDYHSYNQKRVH